MGFSRYNHSPSNAAEQLARLGPAHAVVKYRILCVVFAEDALSIVHRVPTCLFDLQLLVPNAQLQDAVAAICAELPYSVKLNDDNPKHWVDIHTLKDQPHAFDLQKNSAPVIRYERFKTPLRPPARPRLTLYPQRTPQGTLGVQGRALPRYLAMVKHITP
ncbi:hypothetical protein DFH08DRAFT_956390 [Mycena albidolilacea]|uniref:Uncharacterized protein n=1 Tax=Mycena albidolilacea TaxID=1033008 RepID=A0AAD7EUW2_9AGAR|nr:hypothetical protein DFH08DRAFT_956390 [Mycena albidolilacea]